MKYSKKAQPYECDFLNKHLGPLKFSYLTHQSARKENLNSTSRNNKYISSSTFKVVTTTNKSYDLKEWINLLEDKIKELKEEFILEELIIKELSLTHNKEKKSEDIYLQALQSFTYRFWENSNVNSWVEFNSLLMLKYPKQMSERLINHQNKTIRNTTTEYTSSEVLPFTLGDNFKSIQHMPPFILEI